MLYEGCSDGQARCRTDEGGVVGADAKGGNLVAGRYVDAALGLDGRVVPSHLPRQRRALRAEWTETATGRSMP